MEERYFIRSSRGIFLKAKYNAATEIAVPRKREMVVFLLIIFFLLTEIISFAPYQYLSLSVGKAH